MALIGIGVALFGRKSSDKVSTKLAKPNTPLGYGLCFVNLVFDGYTNAAQDEINKRHPNNPPMVRARGHRRYWRRVWSFLIYLLGAGWRWWCPCPRRHGEGGVGWGGPGGRCLLSHTYTLTKWRVLPRGDALAAQNKSAGGTGRLRTVVSACPRDPVHPSPVGSTVTPPPNESAFPPPHFQKPLSPSSLPEAVAPLKLPMLHPGDKRVGRLYTA
eukprot:309568-Chlamydomonas_euryale.AAC.1